MGSQSRFYARWMLPLYPALAILAAYALIQVRQKVVFGVLVALVLIPSTVTTVRNAIVLGRTDTRTLTREWLMDHVPQGTRVVFEPIAPTEWYGETPGGGPKADPARRWERWTRSAALIAELGRDFRGARYPANFQNYERTLFPGMLDVYRREHACWIVTGSTQYGRARAEAYRVPEALKYYAALRRRADVAFKVSPVSAGDKLPRYQVDKSFNSVDGAFDRPGPEMIVYKLRDCT
jgi:hypothetical protein